MVTQENEELDEGNGAKTYCGYCGKPLFIWDGSNNSALDAANHYTLYCCKKCYDAAAAKEEDSN